MTDGYRPAVLGWAAHLQAGGTTSWADWVPGPAGDDGRDGPGAALPGAAQLEAVRRAALRGGSGPALERFADLVLSRSGPGRGLAQQALTWPGQERLFGAPPVDPARVPVEELVRVTVGAVTELVLALPPAPERPATSRLVVEGAPLAAARVRRELATRRLPRRRPRAVVLAPPLDVTLAQVWSARVQGGAAVRWAGFAVRWAGRGALPPSADTVALARYWSARLGPDAVHVLVSRDLATVTARVADLVGARGRGSGSGTAGPWELSPEATDVLRRVNAVLSVRADADRRHGAAGALAAYLRGVDVGPRTPLVVPPRARDRLRRLAEDQAARLAADAAAGVYRVHGPVTDLAGPAGSPAAGRSRPRPERVLDVALAAALALADGRADRGQEPPR